MDWLTKKIILVTFTTMPGTGKTTLIQHLLSSNSVRHAYHIDGDGKELFGNAKRRADVLSITSSEGPRIYKTLSQFMKTLKEDNVIVFIDKNIHTPHIFKGRFNKVIGVPVLWLPIRFSPAKIYNDGSTSAKDKQEMINFIAKVIVERAEKEPNHSLRPRNIGQCIHILHSHMKNQKALKFPRLIEIDVLEEGYNSFRPVDEVAQEVVAISEVVEAFIPIGSGKDEPFQVRLCPTNQKQFWETLQSNFLFDGTQLKPRKEFHITVSYERMVFHLFTKNDESKVKITDIKEIAITHILVKNDQFIVCFGKEWYQFTRVPLHITLALNNKVTAVTTGVRVKSYLNNGILEDDENVVVLKNPFTFPVEAVLIGAPDNNKVDWTKNNMSLQEVYQYLSHHRYVKSTKTQISLHSHSYDMVNMRVFVRGQPDDEIYLQNPDLLALLPRGCTWLVDDNSGVVKRIAVGLPKFFGGKSGDDDDREDEESGALEDCPNSELLEVWGSKKANGENGQISLMHLDDDTYYWVVGSKNVKLILPVDYTADDLVYDANKKYASMIADLWLTIKDQIDAVTLTKLVNKTLIFEMEHVDSHHIVQLTSSVLFLISVLNNDTLKSDHELYETMINKKYVKGLERQKYSDVTSWKEFWNFIKKMRLYEQLEGYVMEITTRQKIDGKVCTVRYKFKTYWYIFLRCLREKLNGYVGRRFQPRSLENTFHNVIAARVKQEVLLKEELLEMKNYATALAGYAAKKWYNVNKEEFIAKYPIYINEFNETIGIKSYRDLREENDRFTTVMKIVDSIPFEHEY